MTTLNLYNTLSRQIEPVVPYQAPQIGLYACGVTVYDYAHIGHLRKYTMDDVLVRVLRRFGYQVRFVQNVTDVGHLASDADTGEDKLEKGAKKYNKSVWDIAKEFEDYFFRSMDLMGNLRPDVSCRATEHIAAQLKLVQRLEEQGYTYVIEGDGVYFDTSKFPEYGKLARLNLEQQKEGARVEKLAGKRNAADFALWKFERPGENRAMVWPSPWAARSFPGWHIECSAMAMQYLGEQFEIHTGGIDHIPVHHTNEIAQAEAATGKQPFVKHWVHHNFVRIEGEKMSKSLGNFFTIDDLLERGFNPRALRLLFLTTHYRSELNFTWENLAGAQKSYDRLVNLLRQFQAEQERTVLSQDKLAKIDQYRERFLAALANDLDTATAVALIWEVAKSNIPGQDKYDLLLEFDEVLALDLRTAASQQAERPQQPEIPAEVQALLDERATARAAKDWAKSDELRERISMLGYTVTDSSAGDQAVVRSS